MKGRLSSTIWMIVTVNVVALLLVLWLAYEAGAHSGGLGLRDAGALVEAPGHSCCLPSPSPPQLPSSPSVCSAARS